MPNLEMKVPSPGESISEVTIANWLVKDGDYVDNGQTIAEIESDKATLELSAEASGTITIKAPAGETVAVGAVACTIDTSAARPEGSVSVSKAETKKTEASSTAATAQENGMTTSHASPVAVRMMVENKINPSKVSGSGPKGRITKADVLNAMENDGGASAGKKTNPKERREKMSNLRRKISERLVSVKNTTAMLTTFNEVNMKPVMDLRSQFKDRFKEKHGVGLGFMSFFTKACSKALFEFPAVNAQIAQDEIVYHDYTDIGIAVSTPKGLMVPVVRNAENLSFSQIEKTIAALATKARDGKITVDEMQGGTFTITNGGVFGSMLSTPIINPPQCAILGMHNIVERPVVINGEIVVRPIMYVALSYDHRLIDGRESVSFLVKVKELLENPEQLFAGGESAEKAFLNS